MKKIDAKNAPRVTGLLLAIENTIRNARKPVNRIEIRVRLKAKTSHRVVSTVLSSLEKRGMIVNSKKGYVWIYNTNPELEKAIGDGREM